MSARLSIIECAGDPRAMGRAQGGACRDAIRERLARAGIRHRGRARASLRPFLAGPVLGAGMAREIVRHFPHLGERFQGMARGAGTSVDALMDLFVRGASGELPDEPIAAEARLGGRAGAHAVVARSLQAEARWIARRSRPEVGFASVELTLPWTATAVAGVNVAGVAVAIAPTAAGRGGLSPSCQLLVQECLQRFGDVAGCLDWCAKRPVSGGATLVLADASGASTAVSIAGDERRVLAPGDDGVFVGGGGLPEPDALRADLGGDAAPDTLLAALGAGVVVRPADRSLQVRTAPGEADQVLFAGE